MEKDGFLDTVDKTEVIRATVKTSRFSAVIFLSCSVIFFLLICGCSFPRIIVLNDPLTPEEHINLGVAYENKGQIELAVEEYKKASKKLPAAFLYLGNLHFSIGKPDEAEAYYRKAIKEQPDLADAYNNLAWLYYTKKERLEDAEKLSLKSLELNPSNQNYMDTLHKIREMKARNGL